MHASRQDNYLVLVEFTVFVLAFTFTLESDNDETDKDIDHEEGRDDEVDDKVECDIGSMVLQGTHVLLIRIDTGVENSRRDVKIFTKKTYGGQPSNVRTTKSVSIALATLSKLSSE